MFLFVTNSFSLLAGLFVWLLNPIICSVHIFNSNSNTLLVSQAKTIPKIDAKIPENLYPCLPKQNAQRLELIAINTTNRSNQLSYYIVGVYNQPEPLSQDEAPELNYQETLVAIDEIGCQVIIPKEKFGMATLTKYLPKTTAYELSLEYRRQAITQAGGRDKYQQLIEEAALNSTPGDFSIYFPEDVWALKKLGIKLPANIKIINHTNRYYLIY